MIVDLSSRFGLELFSAVTGLNQAAVAGLLVTTTLQSCCAYGLLLAVWDGHLL